MHSQPLLRGESMTRDQFRNLSEAGPDDEGRRRPRNSSANEPTQRRNDHANRSAMGRKESIIWPPRGSYLYLGAFFLASCHRILRLHALPIRLSLRLQQYYLPYYLRSDAAGLMHPTSKYRIALCFGRRIALRRVCLNRRCAAGRHTAIWRPSIPATAHSASARSHGLRPLMRGATAHLPEQDAPCVDCALDYTDVPLYDLFNAPFFGPAGSCPAASVFNPQRHRRHQTTTLWPPPQRSSPGQPEGVHKAVTGNGIGITTND